MCVQENSYFHGCWAYVYGEVNPDGSLFLAHVADRYPRRAELEFRSVPRDILKVFVDSKLGVCVH